MRTAAYCPKHWRPWLAGAHRVMPTRIILSHIAHNAKPIYSTGGNRSAAELGFDAPAKERKRRRGKGPREEGPEKE